MFAFGGVADFFVLHNTKYSMLRLFAVK